MTIVFKLFKQSAVSTISSSTPVPLFCTLMKHLAEVTKFSEDATYLEIKMWDPSYSTVSQHAVEKGYILKSYQSEMTHY